MIQRKIMAEKLWTVREVADLVGGIVAGDESVEITGFAPLDSAGPGELTFALDERRTRMLADSQAAAAIVSDQAASCAMPLICVDNVMAALATILGELAGPADLPPTGIDPSAVVSGEAEVAADAAIGPHCVVAAGAKIASGCVLCAKVSIGAGVRVGAGSILFDGVVVRSGCVVGRRVRIGPNSVIGYDGFGYYTDQGRHHRIPHAGNVVIADDVEVGACTCIDRAKFGSTRIDEGTKIDNLCQIAHNVQIGKGCLVAGLVGIAGSAVVGDYAVLGGGSGIRDNTRIGSRAVLGARAVCTHDVPDGQAVFGYPAVLAKEKFRQIHLTGKLPELAERVKKLEKRLGAIESSKDNS